ncbi:MAG: tetratricopeptide repeat protein [Deltaproteobacteria bacterium]|nr:tetratricopeptide repeat protein [Deltaproteobacteria bacterium]
MRRQGPILVALGLALAAVSIALIAGSGPARAQLDAFGFITSSDEMLNGTPEEREALAAMDARKMIRARELAEKVLEKSPDSFLATWVLSQVFHLEEGHHARARFMLAKVKARLLGKYGQRPSDPAAQHWHKRILVAESELLGEMEDREGQVAALDTYDDLYAPKMTRLRIWPLMKLERYDEAIEAAKSLMRGDELVDRVAAYNGLMAIEDERLDRLESYRWGKAGIENTQQRSCILFHNTAQAALTLFKFDEAEELARKAISADYDDCPNPSYEHLVTVYTTEGEFQKAISAFKKLASARIEPRYRQMFDKNNKFYITELLYLLGKFPEGLKMAEIVFSAPDRTGMTSVSLDDIRFGHAALYWLSLEMRIQELRDEGSVRGFSGFVDAEWETKALELKQWELSRILLQLGVKDDILVTNLRPFLRGVRPWWAASLGRMIGTGLVRAALADARNKDEPQLGRDGDGYFTALSGELAFYDGDWSEAVKLGEEALVTLQPQHRLLRWRTMAYIAGALAQRGEGAGPVAVKYLREVLHNFPTALRHLQVVVPVEVSFDEAAFSDDVVDALLDSRRFEFMQSAPFKIRVETADKQVKLCLSAADGFRIGCVDKEIEPGQEEAAEKAVDAFVAGIFSPQVAFTSSDINSLDGSTVRQSSDKALEGILGSDFKAGKGDEDE